MCKKKNFSCCYPTPQNELFFWEGVSFLEYFYEFLGLGHKKILVRLWGHADVLG